MPKAILIMDMPECCADCPCSFFEKDNPILNLMCGPTQEDAYNVGKPDWCPLRELPEKKPEFNNKDEYCEIFQKGWTNSIFQFESPSIRIGKHGEKMIRAGFNACLDEILKK